MMTSPVRTAAGVRMPVRGSTRYIPQNSFKRHPNALTGLGAAALVQQPGPNGVGIQIVDASGDLVYSANQVAANPSLLDQLNQGGLCPDGLLPTYAPGGESTCAQIVEGQTVFTPQFNYKVAGGCPVRGWCLTGSDPSDPNSYTWQGGGSPNVANPAAYVAAQPLPGVFSTPVDAATQLAIQDANAGFGAGQGSGNAAAQILAAAAASQPVVNPNPAVNNVIKPPTGASLVTPGSISNGSPQSGNQNMNAGPGANNASGSNAGADSSSSSSSSSSSTTGATTSNILSEIESSTGLSGTTLLLIAAGVVALMVLKK